MNPESAASGQAADILASRAANRRRGASPAFASRLPAKKNSFHSSRDFKENSDKLHVPASPSAVSDTSSGTDASGTNGRARSSQDDRRPSSGSLSDSRTGVTRIPRPSSSQKIRPTPRQPLNFSDAFRMAEEEEAAVAAAASAQASPSPAPRPWRTGSNGNGSGSRRNSALSTTPTAGGIALTADENRMQRILTQTPLSYGGRRTARRLGESPALDGGPQDTAVQGGSGSTSEAAAAIRRIQYEEDQARMQVVMSQKNGGLFSPKARISPKVAVAGQELHRRASNSSLRSVSNDKASASPSATTTTATGAAAAAVGNASTFGTRLQRWGIRSSPAGILKQAATTGENGGAPARREKGRLPADTRIPSPTKAALLPTSESLNKSFAWEADSDFTAGDLTMSESPRVQTKEANDSNISSVASSANDAQSEAPDVRPRNAKLDELRQLEIDAALKFPDEPSHNYDGLLDALPEGPAESDSEDDAPLQRHHQHSEQQPPSGLPTERTNKKIDEIRALEIENLSRRALATARLDEIRERNAEFVSRKSSREQLAGGVRDDDGGGSSGFLEEEGERVPNTPVTIFRTSSTERGRETTRGLFLGNVARAESNGGSTASGLETRRPSASSSHGRKDSQELLRKLARVTTRSSPGPALGAHAATAGTGSTADQGGGTVSTNSKRLGERPSADSLRGGLGDTGSDNSLKVPKSRDADSLRPSVGFAGLRRVSSSESASTKRSSMVNSDGDPVDRIEAEMKLFAPAETHSERGSIRAPSPDEDSEDIETVTETAKATATATEEAKAGCGNDENNETEAHRKKGIASNDVTPKPVKVDPLTQPTPRVVGAYVDTPVTVKIEKTLETELPQQQQSQRVMPAILSLFRGRASSASAEDGNRLDRKSMSLGSAGDGLTTGSNGGGSLATAGLRRRGSVPLHKSKSRSRSRSRSLPRGRSPLINSAKPTTAHDDLLAIQRVQQMDDSTLENFDELLVAHVARQSSDGKALDASQQEEDDGDENNKDLLLAALDDDLTPTAAADRARLKRMSQSITTGLLDIQSAKKGIERLDRVLQQPRSQPKLAREDGPETTAEEEKKAELVNLKTEEGSSLAEAPRRRRSNEGGGAVEKKVAAGSGTVTMPAQPTESVTYLQIPVPRLYRTQPRLRLTLLGVLLLLGGIWLAVESIMCAMYCRPEVCQAGQDCRWSPDDPWFGVAVPIKLDQWLTGGQGRAAAGWAGEEVSDWLADAWDAMTGTDIRDVDSTYFSFDERRQHRRRLLKRGLIQPWAPPPEARPKLAAWRQAREARERAREMGLKEDGGESMAGDEKVAWW